MKTVKFLGEDCTLEVDHYQASGSPAIQLYCEEGPMARATVNLPNETPAPGEIFVKDYGENNGMAQAFEETGMVKLVRRTNSGFATNGVAVMKITDPKLLKACYPKMELEKPSQKEKSPEPEMG